MKIFTHTSTSGIQGAFWPLLDHSHTIHRARPARRSREALAWAPAAALDMPLSSPAPAPLLTWDHDRRDFSRSFYGFPHPFLLSPTPGDSGRMPGAVGGGVESKSKCKRGQAHAVSLPAQAWHTGALQEGFAQVRCLECISRSESQVLAVAPRGPAPCSFLAPPRAPWPYPPLCGHAGLLTAP